MQVKTLSERVAAFFTGVKDKFRPIHTSEEQAETVRAAKRVRSKDYIFNFDVHTAQPARKVVTTSAGWFFLMNGAAVYFEGLDPKDYPRIAVRFPVFCPNTPFRSDASKLDTMPAGLTFGREGAAGLHFEEYKNLWYVLGDTFQIEAEALLDGLVSDARGTLVITGIEIDLKDTGRVD